MADEIIRLLLISSWSWNKIDNGATFCHVSKISPILSLMPCVTSGSHEWKGAKPSLIAREIKVIVVIILLVSGWNVHNPSCLKLMIMASSRIIEAVACVRKYLVAASVDRGLELLSISGIRASKFISRPTHITNRLELDIVIIGPAIMVK